MARKTAQPYTRQAPAGRKPGSPGIIDRATGAVDNKGAIGTSSWVEYNVTSLVSGNGAYSFVLAADSTDGVKFSSREGATPPQLVLTFVAGSAVAPTPTSPPAPTTVPTTVPTTAPTTAPTSPPAPTTTPTSGHAINTVF